MNGLIIFCMFFFNLQSTYANDEAFIVPEACVKFEDNTIYAFYHRTDLCGRYPKNIIIPNRINGEKVKYIGNNAFYEKNLKKVKLPKYLEKLGRSSFGENELTEIILPDSVKEIGPGAFNENRLSKINFNKVQFIGAGAFRSNKLTIVDIPKYVKIIGRSAFVSNDIKVVNFSEGLERIEYDAFLENEISEVVLPESLNYLGGWAFANNKIVKLVLSSNLKRVYNTTFSFNFGDSYRPIRSIRIGSDVKFDIRSSGLGYYFGRFYIRNNYKAGLYKIVDRRWTYTE